MSIREARIETPETINLDLADGKEWQVGRRAAAGICQAAMVDNGS
jgi:hypothetical protein